ncbi:MAG: two-component regulator propeller domain-containing protein [bacterium]
MKLIQLANFMRNALLVSAALLFGTSDAFTQGGPILDIAPQLWQSFTNMRNVRALERSPQGLWAATTGGVLFWDLNEQRYRTFNNTEGLSQNETSTIALDRRGQVWIGHTSGLIDVYDPQQNSFKVINDLQAFNYAVLDFFALGDSMYIAHSSGISLYVISREEVKETYRNLGVGIQSDTVRSIFIDGRDLWAATNSGVAKTSLNLPNLQAPESWTNYVSGLPSNRVLGFTKYQGTIIATCPNGIAAFNGAAWENRSGNLGGLVFRQTQAAIIAGSEKLYAVTANGLYESTAPLLWALVGHNVPNLTGMVVDARSRLWLSTTSTGLLEHDPTNNSWLPHEPDGPATNSITSIALDHEGNVWCASGFADLNVAFLVYDGQRWHKFSTLDNPLIHDDCRHVEVLQNGDRWISSWGGGIVVAKGSLDNLQFSRIDASNGLAGIPANPNFVTIPYFKQDAAGNVWICNYIASNSNTLACLTPQGEWRYFSSAFQQISPTLVTLEIERTTTADRIWVGTNEELGNPGVSVVDYNGTIGDPSDDRHAGTLKLEDGLRSTNITTLAQDRDGFMWIGTADGFYYWFAGAVQERFGVINENIRVIGIDPRNNKWVGTANGISVLSGEDNFTFQSITIENSPLVSTVITDFAFNPNNGEVWISTTNGISRLRTPFTAPKQDLSALSGYPNPFRLSAQGSRFVITNLVERAAVKIFTIDGSLVRTFALGEVPGAQVAWDGRDDKGELVPSGVYLFMAFVSETGASGVGKVAVIRQ